MTKNNTYLFEQKNFDEIVLQLKTRNKLCAFTHSKGHKTQAKFSSFKTYLKSIGIDYSSLPLNQIELRIENQSIVMTKKRINEIWGNLTELNIPENLITEIIKDKAHNRSHTILGLKKLFSVGKCYHHFYDLNYVPHQGQGYYDSLSDIAYLLREAGIGFRYGNDAPRGGKRGDYIILDISYQRELKLRQLVAVDMH